MTNNDAVKNYFEDKAKEFDSIYDNKGSVLDKIANKLFRKGMKQRIDVLLEECGRTDKTVLDIGCGSGRISLMLAERGMKVTGIDYSREMIDLSNRYLEEHNEKSSQKLSVTYMHSNFLKDFSVDGKYDISVAIGVVDYIRDPVPFLQKIMSITKEKLVVSYPAKYSFQNPIRKTWLYMRNCPVYFYSKKDIENIYTYLHIKKYDIVKVSAGYVVTGYKDNSNAN